MADIYCRACGQQLGRVDGDTYTSKHSRRVVGPVPFYRDFPVTCEQCRTVNMIRAIPTCEARHGSEQVQR